MRPSDVSRRHQRRFRGSARLAAGDRLAALGGSRKRPPQRSHPRRDHARRRAETEIGPEGRRPSCRMAAQAAPCTFCTRAERCRSSDSLFSILHSLFPAPMPDILIADDHPLFRDALQRAVLAALPQARVHSADSVHALLGLIEQFPDAELLLLDLHMPGAHGYSALAHIRGQYPGLPTIVVSGHEEAQVARRALAHGASAYRSEEHTSE